MVKDTIGKILQKTAQYRGRQEAFVHTEVGVRYNYDLLWWDVERFARGLMKAGIEKGDRVALRAANIPEWIVAFLGTIAVGGITVPVNPDSTEEEMRYILFQSESKCLILDTDTEIPGPVLDIRQLREDVGSLAFIITTSRIADADTIHWKRVMDMGRNVEDAALTQRADAVFPEDPVAIMYTSGTTGKPKGVVLDHLGLVNKSLVSTARQGIVAEDRLCLFFPLFHMFGNTCIALAGLLKGATLVAPCIRFDPAAVLKAIPAEKCTAIYGSPSMMIALVDHPAFNGADWASVKKGIIGGAPCPVELMRRLVEDVGISDITVAYGITETASWITMTRPADPIERRVSTIGVPLECNEVRIVDPKSGAVLEPGDIGELCTRGFVMKEYYHMPAATAAAVDPDGWFHTGDLGVMDEDGYVKITGRLKDVITRNGVDIYPVEIEEVLYEIPEISEAQVFGFPASGGGQEVAAWIRLKEGAVLPIHEVEGHVRNRVEPRRRPQYYKFVSGFPMTGSGKIQKFKLSRLAQEEYRKKESHEV
ncbi:MAG: AMP-binding protein [Deltaproteobacteria bacterium]|nr:AMP-binding protein [Deltaproteobacteria bacterium]